jgi:hypothetical protein
MGYDRSLMGPLCNNTPADSVRHDPHNLGSSEHTDIDVLGAIVGEQRTPVSMVVIVHNNSMVVVVVVNHL